MHEPIFQMNIYTKILPSQKKRNEKNIWQIRCYDHIIRDEKDLCRHVDSIHYNTILSQKIGNIQCL